MAMATIKTLIQIEKNIKIILIFQGIIQYDNYKVQSMWLHFFSISYIFF